jgi:hypothetical protein
MANNNESNENRWVDERLQSLDAPDVEPNYDAARGRLRERDASARTMRRRWTTAAAIAAAILLLAALPWPRAAAQRLWDRLTLGRVEVVRVAQEHLPEPVNPFDWKEENDERIEVRDATEAERVAGFHPLLPPADVVSETPKLTVSKRGVMSSTVKVADLQRALVAAGNTGVFVPVGWEGVTLRVERGPEIEAIYEKTKFGISQSAPLKLTTPSGFPVGEFMEIAYRLYGKTAVDARELSRKFIANPAWMLVFPGHDTVRELPWKGGRAVAAGGQDSMCFFWNTSDRLFILGAQKMDPDFGVAVANSLQ